MTYLLLGLAALAIGLLALHGFTRANPARMARQLKALAGAAALVGAAGLLYRGYASYALPLAVAGVWLVWGGGPPGRWGGAPQPGQASRVLTDHLEMELDHDSGAMRGRVLRGIFKGRALEGMAPAEIALLWQDCRFSDPQSAQILEAFLDRVHPSWREDLARAEAEPGAGGVMTRAEALEVLGLAEGATADDVRRAHKELMKKLHPDRGGSTYLAAKVNEAKDLLLGA